MCKFCTLLLTTKQSSVLMVHRQGSDQPQLHFNYQLVLKSAVRYFGGISALIRDNATAVLGNEIIIRVRVSVAPDVNGICGHQPAKVRDKIGREHAALKLGSHALSMRCKVSNHHGFTVRMAARYLNLKSKVGSPGAYEKIGCGAIVRGTIQKTGSVNTFSHSVRPKPTLAIQCEKAANTPLTCRSVTESFQGPLS